MIASTLAKLVVSLLLTAAPADFYVAPDGEDTNPGTEAAPFASPARARDAVRALVADGLAKDVTVLVRGGTYVLDEPLAFGPEDSGTAEYRITYAAYPGERPVISGGRAVSGWTKAEGGKWTVELPEVKSGSWQFRQLFSGGKRLPRARFPNGRGLLRVESVSPDVKQIVLDEASGMGSLAGKDAELVMYQNWSISRAAIVDTDGRTVSVANPMGWIGHGAATTASPGKPCYIEHAPEFVDEPGEWRLDRKTGVLTYMAAEEEDPNEGQFVAPRLERLLVVNGRADAPVQNLHFTGLSLEHAAWRLPDFGYLGIQAGHHGTTMSEPACVLPVTIEFAYAEDCGLERCRVAHVGATGIGLGAGCRRTTIAGCEVTDIGGNGIMVGWRGKAQSHRVELAGDESLSGDWRDPRDVPTGNAITNCVIRNCGAVNHGCVGIYDGFCAETRIAHNLVTDMPYTGISIGFRWNTSETSQRGTICEYNHVHDVMKMLADGGCIYTLGYQPGTVLRGNLLHHVHRSAFAHGGAPNNGVFFDQGSKGYLVEGNIIYDTSGEPIRFNQTDRDNMTWQNNSFGVPPGDPAFPEAAAKKAGPIALSD